MGYGPRSSPVHHETNRHPRSTGHWTKHAERGRVVSRALSSGFVGTGRNLDTAFDQARLRPRVNSMATESGRRDPPPEAAESWARGS